MSKLMVCLIVILAVLSLAPGCPPGNCPTPVKPPPPTEPPPPVVTEPPIVLTEPPVVVTEPPAVFTEVAPKDQPTQWKPDTDKFRNASLPSSGYGPQSDPAQVDLVCGGMALLLMVVAAFVVLR